MSKDRNREMSRLAVGLAKAIDYAWCWHDRVQIGKALSHVIREHEQMNKEEQHLMTEQGATECLVSKKG